ncbi:growth-regulating factor 3 [Rhodamnia argentea]|uniref:Growth-regulating factor n=1 Tax=Rhodamnia argentea TaxID=178133 RepID=A0A8B8PCC9_9MYRT|nr:growth-regulating factor 3 [Rhodamnia argentea]
MDLQLKQWRRQQDGSEPPPAASEAPSAKLPRLVLDGPHHPQSQSQSQSQSQPMQSLAAASSSSSSSTLSLFVPDKLSSNMTAAAFPDSAPAVPRSFPRMGSYFSWAQRQELELQALIYRFMLAGAAVPAELLQPIKKSLLQAPCFLHHPLGHLQHYPQYQPALLQAGYWGRASMDPEPGRCRRTDGKKWRCSRDVVPGQKYCERHMHRGRNRSRKPVEIPTPAAAAAAAHGGAAGGFGGSNHKSADPVVAAAPLAAVAGGGHFSLSGPSPSIDLFQSYSEPKGDEQHLFESRSEVNGGSGRSDGHILRHFFDDWPRSLQDSDNSSSNASPMSSSTCLLSISIPGNPSSDVSLKLSTGHGSDEPSANGRSAAERDPPQLGNWGTGWSPNQVASMGGPLAEALRSSTSHSSSPTSVLHQQVPRGLASASEASYVST